MARQRLEDTADGAANKTAEDKDQGGRLKRSDLLLTLGGGHRVSSCMNYVWVVLKVVGALKKKLC